VSGAVEDFSFASFLISEYDTFSLFSCALCSRAPGLLPFEGERVIEQLQHSYGDCVYTFLPMVCERKMVSKGT